MAYVEQDHEALPDRRQVVNSLALKAAGVILMSHGGARALTGRYPEKVTDAYVSLENLRRKLSDTPQINREQDKHLNQAFQQVVTNEKYESTGRREFLGGLLHFSLGEALMPGAIARTIDRVLFKTK